MLPQLQGKNRGRGGVEKQSVYHYSRLMTYDEKIRTKKLKSTFEKLAPSMLLKITLKRYFLEPNGGKKWTVFGGVAFIAIERSASRDLSSDSYAEMLLLCRPRAGQVLLSLVLNSAL